MAQHSYIIPRNTKGEGKILMIFSKKALLWTIACGVVGLLTIYPICIVLGFKLIGLVGILLSGLVGFIIGTCKMPESQNFEIFRKTGGENIDEVLIRLLKFKRKGKKLYLYNRGGKENE